MPFDNSSDVDSFVLPAHAGVWWRGHEAELREALVVANRAAPHLAHLAHMLLPRLPRRVLASSSIKGAGTRASSRILPLAEALLHQWVAFNSRNYINTETADIDEAMTWRAPLAEMADEHGMPMPAAMVASPYKGTVHLLWIYGSPVPRRSEAAMRLRRGVRRGLVMLGGCPRFSNTLQKNPWHLAPAQVPPDEGTSCGDPAMWGRYCAEQTGLTYHTEVLALGTVEMRDLFGPLAAAATARKVTLLEHRPEGRPACHIPLGVPEDVAERRGSRLFLTAARAVKRACTGDAALIHDIVARTAIALSSPASAAEIAKIAHSITVWMNSRWWGRLDGRCGRRKRPIDAGVMKGEAVDRGPTALAAWRALGIRQRRQAAAARTNGARIHRVDQAIRSAVSALVREGEDITQTAVATRAGVSVSSVQRRWRTLEVTRPEGHENPSHGLIHLWGNTPTQPPIPSPHPVTPPCSVGDLARDMRATLRHDRRADRKAVRHYRAQAARMRRRGAGDEVVAPLPSGARMAVLQARGDALRAQNDLRRRIAGRRQRERQLRAAEDRASWHAAHAWDEAAWTERLRSIGERRDDAVHAAKGRGNADRMELMFASVFAAEYRARRRARGESEYSGQGDRRPRDRMSPATGQRRRRQPPQGETVPAPTADAPRYVMPAFMRRMPQAPAGARVACPACVQTDHADSSIMLLPG